MAAPSTRRSPPMDASSTSRPARKGSSTSSGSAAAAASARSARPRSPAPSPERGLSPCNPPSPPRGRGRGAQDEAPRLPVRRTTLQPQRGKRREMTAQTTETSTDAVAAADAAFFAALLDRDLPALERILAGDFLIVDVASGDV